MKREMPLHLLALLVAAGVPIITTTLEATPAMLEERLTEKAEIPVDTEDAGA